MRKTLISLAISVAIILCSATIVNASNITFLDDENGENVGEMNGVHTRPQEITVEEPTKDGYEFNKWDTDDETITINNEENTISGANATYVPRPWPGHMEEPEATVYATWDVVEYEIVYDLDGGEAEGNPDTYTVESEDITLNNPTKAGYEFDGWTNAEEEELGTEVTIPQGSTGDRDFTALWTPEVYTISYVLDGGTATGNPDTYTIEDEVTLNNPTKDGYKFVGWLDEEGTDLGTEVTIAEGSMGDRTFTAVWELIPEETTVETAKVTSNPATGDNIIAYVTVFALATAGIVTTKKMRK